MTGHQGKASADTAALGRKPADPELTGVGAVIIVAMPDDEHVLLIREYACGVHRYELGLPKGRLEIRAQLIDRDGVIRWFHMGPVTVDDPSLNEALETALAQS